MLDTGETIWKEEAIRKPLIHSFSTNFLPAYHAPDSVLAAEKYSSKQKMWCPHGNYISASKERQ